jgi:hypothetical protein
MEHAFSTSWKTHMRRRDVSNDAPRYGPSEPRLTISPRTRLRPLAASLKSSDAPSAGRNERALPKPVEGGGLGEAR